MLVFNKLNITYSVAVPNGRKVSKKAESNAVNTDILTYSVLKEIRSDKTAVRAGDSAGYTVTVTNNSAAKLFNNLFSISQPNASFEAGSVKINGNAQPTYDPVSGFALPDLNPGDTIVIEYKLKADKQTSTPITHFAALHYTVNDPARGNVNYAENTDTVSLIVIYDNISVIKTVDKSFACKGENLHYTVKITNIGNTTKNGLIFIDPIPIGTEFVENSIRIDGTAYSVYNPETGFVLRGLAPNETTAIEFDVKVN